MSYTIKASTSLVSDREWTVADVEVLPGGYRYDLLDGVLFMVAMPAWPHPAVVENLRDLLGPWVRKQGLGRVLGPQAGVYLNDRNYVDPDLIFLRHEQFPVDGKRPTTAALAIEVLSRTNLREPREERELLFQRAAVEEVWYVDPRARTLEIRRLTGAGYRHEALFQGDAQVTSTLLPGFSFALTECWVDLAQR